MHKNATKKGSFAFFLTIMFVFAMVIGQTNSSSAATKTYSYKGKTYNIIKVYGGDTSGTRKANVAVDIGYGKRVYWGLTNQYGQLVYVVASKITLQNDDTEAVNSEGRYYDDEAHVPGAEKEQYDQGHVIADSLGGVSNTYNITPQDSTLNRHGDQAYMEEVIREAGGCRNFTATITYPNTTTQIPSHYKYVYTLNGEKVTDSFDNVNPDEINTQLPDRTTSPSATDPGGSHNLDAIDTDHNGRVTIAEAKAAGYKMPITRDHWLYQYMTDNDHDGMVGE